MTTCHKGEKYGKSLLVDSREPINGLVGECEQDADFDDNEDIVIGDEGILLVVRRVCLTPRKAGAVIGEQHLPIYV
jgi:hypothetical protein